MSPLIPLRLFGAAHRGLTNNIFVNRFKDSLELEGSDMPISEIWIIQDLDTSDTWICNVENGQSTKRRQTGRTVDRRIVCPFQPQDAGICQPEQLSDCPVLSETDDPLEADNRCDCSLSLSSG